MSAGSLIHSFSKKNSICFSPRPSMSKARREANSLRCSIFWKMIWPGFFWTPVQHHVDHLRDDVAGALDDDRIADADIAALAQLLAVTADALYIILVVQGGVLHDHPADADGLKLRHRCQRPGAADLDLDVLQDGGGAFRRKFMCDRPARAARDESQPFLPVDAIHFVDDAVDIVIESGAALLDLAMEGNEFFG
jgi:hypothetical protein